MRTHTSAPPKTHDVNDPVTFGRALRLERLRRGVSLEALASTTKISSALFAALEAGDCSRWPGGVYRRAFVRSYAERVGLDPDTVLQDFLRCFPEEGGPRPYNHAPPGLHPAAPFRLRMDEPSPFSLRALSGRLVTAGADAGLALVAAAVLIVAGVAPWMALALAALVLQGAGTLALGESPGRRLVARVPTSRRTPSPPAGGEEEPAVTLRLAPADERFDAAGTALETR